MRVANRYNTVITRASMKRSAKEKALTTRYAGVSTARTGSKSTVTQLLLQQLYGNRSASTSTSTSSTAERLAEYQSRIYGYGVVNVAAGRVGKQMSQLMQEGENSLFAKAEESGDYSEIGKSLSSFVGDYNLMIRKLKESGDSGDAAYVKQLKAEMSKNYSALKALGISSDSDGLLTFDEKAFEAADKEKLKELFGPSSELAAGLKKLAGKIETYALQQQKDLQEKMYTSSTSYNQYGSSDLYGWLSGSTYNAKG